MGDEENKGDKDNIGDEEKKGDKDNIGDEEKKGDEENMEDKENPGDEKPSNQGSPEHSSGIDSDVLADLGPPRFWCSDCDAPFYERNGFNQHMEHNHPQASVIYMCRQCNVEQPSFEDLREHLTERHTVPQIFSCTICNTWFWNRKALQFHYERHIAHRRRRTCETCNQLLASRHRLRDHLRLEHTVWAREFQCSVCGSKFIRDYNKFRQQQIALGKDGKTRRWVPVCKRCGQIFVSKLFLDHHNCDDRPREDEGGLVVCSGCCNGTPIEEQAAREEEQKEEDEDTHECEVCYKHFSKPENLKKHKRIHEETEGVMCDKCRRRYRNQEVLSKHRKICGEPKPGPSNAPD